MTQRIIFLKIKNTIQNISLYCNIFQSYYVLYFGNVFENSRYVFRDVLLDTNFILPVYSWVLRMDFLVFGVYFGM